MWIYHRPDIVTRCGSGIRIGIIIIKTAHLKINFQDRAAVSWHDRQPVLLQNGNPRTAGPGRTIAMARRPSINHRLSDERAGSMPRGIPINNSYNTRCHAVQSQSNFVGSLSSPVLLLPASFAAWPLFMATPTFGLCQKRSLPSPIVRNFTNHVLYSLLSSGLNRGDKIHTRNLSAIFCS